MTNVSRIVVLAGSICGILRGLGVPDSALLRHWVAPLNETNTLGSEGRGWELGVAGSDDCIEDCGSRGLHL